MATTFAAIRDAMIANIKAISPSTITDVLFDYVPKRHTLLEWTASAGSSGTFRTFEIVRTGPTEQLPHLSPDTIRREEFAAILVAYPRAVAAYGDDELLDLDDVMREDARQIRDVIMSTSNFVASQHEAVVTIEDVSRDGGIWFQPFTVRLQYDEAQSLT